MFTGLVREIGKIRSLSRSGQVTRLQLSAPVCAGELQIGDSLAVNGICLTVTRRSGVVVTVEAAAETRRITTLRRWRSGDRVHLEPALRAGDAMGGHLVLGHVDGLGQVARGERSGRSLFLTLTVAPTLARYLLPKGSVAVDGVSLTVDSGPFGDRFTVNVIPHTLTSTRLGALRVGDQVNLEMDVLVKAARGESARNAASTTDLSPAGQPASERGNSAGKRPPSRGLAYLLSHGFRRRSDAET